MGDELVRVERFEELATGMRVVRQCSICANEIAGLVGNPFCGDAATVEHRSGSVPASVFRGRIVSFTGPLCPCGYLPVITDRTVRERRVFRFASDRGIADAIAAEGNPYTDRTVVGTGGREETRILTRERGR